MTEQTAAIAARDLVKRYGDLIAVDGLDLTVPRGICLGLLGPNGAGKTTTIEMLVGLRRPDGGQIEILGRRWDRDGKAIRAGIGVQLQETQLPEKNTVWELLRLFRSFYARGRKPEDVLGLIDLREKKNRRVEKLSGGQRQRLTLGCAIIHDPDILFLDEPTTGLDPQARRTVWQVIEDFKKQGGTVLLTTHYMDEAERLSEQIVILDRGRILQQGTPARIIESLQADRVIRIAFESMPEDDPGPVLEALPGVRSVRRGEPSFSLVVEEGTLPKLLELVRGQGWRLADLHTHRTTLDDVFVSLTGRHLQDEHEPRDPGADANASPAPAA